MTVIFQHLRQTPWNPTFTWVGSIAKAADQINSFHEDYPLRVGKTAEVIERLERWDFVSGVILKLAHLYVFADTSFRGKWRDVDVKVGAHRPPDWQLVPHLMEDLELEWDFDDLAGLKGWYADFETIHPFQDGNGRVGGIVVAAYSHALHPERGWLAVEQ